MHTTVITLDDEIGAAATAHADGDMDSALGHYQSALAIAERNDPTQRAPLLRRIGGVLFERGDYDAANRNFEASLVAAQALKQTEASASALNAMAACAQFSGRLDIAESLYVRASSVADSLDDSRLSALIDQNLGTLASTRGDLASALMRFQSALERFRAIDDQRAIGMVLNNMGRLRAAVGEFGAAEMCYQAAYSAAELLNDTGMRAKIDTNRAQLFLRRQNFEMARECCDRAFTAFGRIGSDSGLSEVHRLFGVLYFETGKLKVAHVQLNLSLKLARSCGHPLLEAECESDRARIFIAERQHRQAIRSLNRAHELFVLLDARREILDLERRLDQIGDSYHTAAQIWLEDTHALRGQQKSERGKRVAEYATALAREVKHADLMWLRVGAHLRDIGNAAVPREILNKTTPLTEIERRIVEQHTIIGEHILQELSFPEQIRPVVRHHHECWDGTGYPDRLAGEKIPASARILCIADVFDALTTDRADRPAHGLERSLEIMESLSGSVFDPELFTVFRTLVGRGTFAARA